MSPAPLESAEEDFPWCYFILFELLHLSICYPTSNAHVRQWLLAPAMVAISVYLYAKHPVENSVAYSIGSYIAFQLCSMMYLVYIQTGFPDFWRRVKDETSDDENKLPSRFSFERKIAWALDLGYNVRRVGWSQERMGLLPPRPICSRTAFIRLKILYFLMHLLIFDLVITYHAGNPAFDPRVHHATDGPETYIRGKPLLWRIPDVISGGARLICGVRLMHTAMAVIFVWLGLSEPSDWPDMFGSSKDAYSLRLFWGRVWHQRMRTMFSGIGQFVTRNVCRLDPGTILSSSAQLYITFFLSGLVHAGGDYMALGYLPLFSFRFFLLQAVAISFEDFVIWIAKPVWSKMNQRVNKAAGYLWVVLWFFWAAPLWLDPMSAAGIHIHDRGAIFGRVLDSRPS